MRSLIPFNEHVFTLHTSRYNYHVNLSTQNHLLELNRQFYQTFGIQFSATRHRLQPGVQRIVKLLPESARILDLGCGNGELANELAHRGYQGLYIGLDFSPPLLGVARSSSLVGEGTQPHITSPATYHFIRADLSSSDWDSAIPGRQFDIVLAFAVLHHLPGSALRLRIMQKVRTLISPAGRFIHSQWQFLNSARLRARIQSWEAAGLAAGDIDLGDYLLDWRHGGNGLRYVHHFSEAELATLAEESGFQIEETFYSDGEEGNLSLYQIWAPV